MSKVAMKKSDKNDKNQILNDFFGSVKMAKASNWQMAGDKDRQDEDGDNNTTVLLEPKQKLKRPSLYRVLLLNDDYTPMEFVIQVLERFFNKNREEATEIMLHVHHRGVGECGVYTFEVAETKVTQVMNLAKEHQHPLQCVMEKK